MLRKLRFVVVCTILSLIGFNAWGQTPTVTVDLSGAADTSVIITGLNRNGSVCGSPSGERCIVFNIILNSGSDVLNFNVQKPGPDGGAFYRIDCGTPTSLNTPVCVSGKTTVSISFCKNGNDTPEYIITAARTVKASGDLTLRQGCSGTMSVTGLQTSTIVWTSIFPGAQGAYNSYLSPATGSATTTVTPQIGAPAYIDYLVTGNQSTICTGPRSDTVRIYTAPPLTVSISPASPVICPGANVLLTATPSGGSPAYTYLWNTGATTPSITVSSPGTYTVQVTDQVSNCPAVPQSVTVGAAATPAAPTAPGTTICSGSTATLTATAPGGTYRWYDAASGGNLLFTGASFTTPALATNTTYYVETLLGCVSPRTPVTVSVTQPPAAPTAAGTTICSGTTASLLATAPGGTYEWFDAAVGGTLLFTGANFITPALTANTTYYVQTTVNGCPGPRTAVIVTVTPLPVAPTAAGTTICSGTTATLTATAPAGTYEWYDSPAGGMLLGTNASFTTPILSTNTTYYVQATVNGCTGPRAAVLVTVNPPPVAPTAAGTTICSGATATLTATAPGGTYRWFDAPSGGNLLSTGAIFITPILTANTTYYVETLLGCLSPRTPVTVSVTPLPPAPTASGTTICSGSTATFVATAPGGTYEWYDNPAGGTLLATGISYTTPALTTTTTYYVQTTVNGCPGPRTAVTATVTPLPAAPTAAGGTICAGTSTTLTASAPGGTYQWFDAASGGNLLETGSSYLTPVLNATTTYYVQTTVGGCPGPRTAVTVTIMPIVTPEFEYLSGTYCKSGPAVSDRPTIHTPEGGTFSADPGLVFTDITTGEIDILNTPIGTYRITFTNATACPRASSALVTITNAPDATFSYATNSFCKGNANVQAIFPPGASAGFFSASPGGLVFISTSTGEIDLSASAPNTYIITNFIAAGGGCIAATASFSITITASPAAPTFTGPTTICAGSATTLTANVAGATLYEWFTVPSGGIPVQSSGSASYLTPTLSTTTTYYVQATVNGCPGPRAAVTVTVNPTPAAPTVSGTTICAGGTATLIATAPGGTYRWYDAAIGGNLLETNIVFTIPGLTINTTFYLETTINNCPSPRTAVTVIVTPIPAAPTAASQSICTGTSTTLTATAPGGNYEWYDAANGGNLIFSGSSFLTPILTTSTSYYVQTTVSGCPGPRTRVDVTVTPIPPAPMAPGTTICAGNTATLTAASAPGALFRWYDAPSGGTLLFSFASYTTPVLAASTTYYVEAEVSGCTGPRTAVTVNVTPTPPAVTALGATICSGSTATLVATAPGGIYQWYDAASGGNLLVTSASYTTPVLTTTTTYYVQTTINGCPGPRTAVTITVNPIPVAPTASGTTICAGSSASLTASVSGGIYDWYDAALGGNMVATGASFTTPVLTVGTTYYVQSTINGCTGPRTRVDVTVTPIPAAPTAIGTGICAGNTAILTASGPGGAYQWYDAASGGTLLASSASFTTPVLAITTTFYVQATVNGCPGPRTAVTVNVTPIPPAVTALGETICAGSTATLVATAPGGIYQWYDAASGGTLLASSASFTSPILSTSTTYYVQATINGCTGPRTAVTVTVTPTPAAPTAAGAGICVGTTATLTASAPGGIYDWYDAAVGGNLIFTGASFTTPVLTVNTTYYVQATINGCAGPRTLVDVTVSPIPAAPTAPGITICSGNTATLTASAPGGIYEWYDAASGGTLLSSSASFTTPILTSSTTYYVQAVVNGCIGPRSSVTVTITPIPPAVTASNVTICVGTTATLVASAPGGVYQWYDAASGGTLLATAASFTSPVLTTSTTYYVQATINGCTGPRTAVTVTVTPAPAAPTASGTTICTGSTATLTATGPGGNYSWYDASVGGNLLASSASFVTPALTANTTYYVETMLVCLSPRTAVTVVVTPLPPAPSASGITICSGNTATVTAVGPGGTYQWYDAPSGGNLLVTAASFTSPALTANTTYYVQTTVNGCPGPRTAVTITVIPTPPAPTVSAPIICVGTSTTLTASAPGGNYQWYDAASGGNLLQTGSTYTTPVLNATTTFYVQSTINGCTSPRAAVTVGTVSITTPEFEYSSGTYCKSGPAVTPAPIIHTPGGGTFSATPGLVFANNTTGEINVTATPLGTYTITFTNNSQCPRSSSVNITITNAPDASFSYPSSLFCIGSSNVLPIFPAGASAGIFSSTPGLVFISPSTGEINLSASTAGTYLITNNIAASGGCAPATASFSITISPSPLAPTVSTATICAGNATTLIASTPGGTYQWFTAATGGNLVNTGNIFQTLVLFTTTTYYVQTTVNGCTSPRRAVTVNVIPVIDPEFEYSSGTYCKSGTTITPAPVIHTVGGGIFSSTTGLVFANISTGEIDVSASVIGTYTVSFTNNSPCPRTTFAKVTITNAPDATFSFTGPHCLGATNPLPNFGVGASAGLFTSSSPALVFVSVSTGQIDLQLSSPGTYTITNTIAASGGCTAATYSSTITIVPTPPIPTISDMFICAGNSATLTIVDTGGSYQWFDAATGGNMIGTGSTFITPILSSTTRYYVQAINGACPSPRKEVLVTVYLIPTAPVMVSNSPVCMGNPLVLGAGYVPGAVYTWKGPDNFSSSLQNPFINSATLANSGTYSLYITVNGCSSPVTTVDVKINPLPVVTAGPDQTLCISTNSVSLSGTVSGLSTNGIWTSSGTGVFSPSNTSVNATYIPSTADKANLKVILTLTSLNNQSCAPAVSSMTVTFVPLPVVNAGANQVICADVADINLSGLVSGATGGIWSTTGDGSFSSSNSLKTTYIPGAADIKNKSVTLTLTSTGNGFCSAIKDDLLVTINPLPIVSAGKDRTILQDQPITLEGTSNTSQVQYLWSPTFGLSDYAIRNPVFSATSTQTYTLTITNEWGCVASDAVTITVLEPIKIPNTFTPNGDGVNDVWNIAKLKDYPDAVVNVYNRYGVKIFYSEGYDQPWDGTFKGEKVPFGTYYYLIDTKFPGQIFSGYIVVIE